MARRLWNPPPPWARAVPCEVCRVGIAYVWKRHMRACCSRRCETRLRNWRQHYGLSPADFWRLWEEQHGRCAMPNCGSPLDRKVNVDHDHATGLVRGLLCPACNVGLVLIDRVGNAAIEEYLSR